MKNYYEDDIVFARFLNYMKKALLNKRLDYIRMQQRLLEKEKIITEKEWSALSDEDNTIHSFSAFYKKEEEKEKRILINDALGRLNPKEKDILFLFYYKNNSLKEIAKELKIPINNIGQIKQRALKKLKKNMEEYENEE